MPHYGAIPNSRSTSALSNRSEPREVVVSPTKSKKPPTAVSKPRPKKEQPNPESPVAADTGKPGDSNGTGATKQKCDCGEEHEASATKDSYQCNICGRRFCSEVVGMAHLREVHGEHCDLCDRTFASEEELEFHCHEKHFVCIPECDYIGNSEKDFRHHIEETHFRCAICEDFFFLHNDLVQHNFEKHTPTFGCDLCGVSFPSRDSLRMHAVAVHYPCTQCIKFFRSHRALDVHIKEDHRAIDYPCGQCGKTFHSKDSWYWHSCQRKRRGSEGPVRHPCEQCGEVFNSKEELDDHENTAHLPSNVKAEFSMARNVFEHNRTKSLPATPIRRRSSSYSSNGSEMSSPPTRMNAGLGSPMRGGVLGRAPTMPAFLARSRITSITEHDTDGPGFEYAERIRNMNGTNSSSCSTTNSSGGFINAEGFEQIFYTNGGMKDSNGMKNGKQSIMSYRGLPDVFFSTLAVLAFRKLRHPQLVEMPEHIHPLLQAIRDNAYLADPNTSSREIEEVE